MSPAPTNPPPMSPTPMPPAPTHALMRVLSGPLLLTTLGVLLTIDYMGGITFGRSWPVLLIVFGLCKVAEYAGPRGI